MYSNGLDNWHGTKPSAGGEAFHYDFGGVALDRGKTRGPEHC